MYSTCQRSTDQRGKESKILKVKTTMETSVVFSHHFHLVASFTSSVFKYDLKAAKVSVIFLHIRGLKYDFFTQKIIEERK